MDFPFIVKGGKEIKRYIIGDDTLVFIENPESVGPIKYKFVGMLYQRNNDYPSIFITSEYNTLNPLPDPQYFLNFYHNDNRKNLGQIELPYDFKQFEVKAFVIVNGVMKYDKNTKVEIKSNSLISKIYNAIRYAMLTLLAIMIIYLIYLENRY